MVVRHQLPDMKIVGNYLCCNVHQTIARLLQCTVLKIYFAANRTCLDQLLIAMKLSLIVCDHVLSKTRLIAIWPPLIDYRRPSRGPLVD